MKVTSAVKLLLLVLFSSALQATQEVEIYTEDYPPYNMIENHRLTGLSVDILAVILKRIGSKKTKENVNFASWSRGYSLAKTKKNTMVFSTTRTEKRENLFKWVGPIAKTTIVLLALKEKNIKVPDYP